MEKTNDQFAATTNAVLQRNAASLTTATEMINFEKKVISRENPVLELNLEAFARAGYLTPNQMWGGLAEKYRFLKRSLLWDIYQSNEYQSNEYQLDIPLTNDISRKYSNLIIITSALPGEGKTFTAFNLAMSIATTVDTTKVILVDCDLAGYSLTHLVGLINAPGLTNLILDHRLCLSEAVVHTNIPKFKLIPVGTYHDAIELLAAKKLGNIVHELSTQYKDHIILFDSMSLLSNTQALLLTLLVEKILVVVEEGKTPQKVVKEAVSILDQNKTIGLVLNKCSR